MTEFKCTACDDTRWVCTVHRARPWAGTTSPRRCPCDAEGFPCPACNTADPPDLPPGFLDHPRGGPRHRTTPPTEAGADHRRACGCIVAVGGDLSADAISIAIAFERRPSRTVAADTASGRARQRQTTFSGQRLFQSIARKGRQMSVSFSLEFRN
jgi:hypothetical protein